MTRRQFGLFGVGGAAAAALLATCAASPIEVPAEAATASDSRRVMTFMYLWYGDEAGNYTHWNHAVLPHWRPIDGLAFKHATGRRFAPPEEIHAPFWPRRGLYSSSDPVVLEEQMREMRAAGIGVAVVSWWGRPDVPGTHDSQGVNTDAVVPAVLAAAAKENMRVAFHLEPYEGRTAASVVKDVEYIRNRYGAHRAVLRTTRAALGARPSTPLEVPSDEGGVPLFFVYDSYHIPAEDWALHLNAGGALHRKGVFFGLVLRHQDQGDLARGAFDGLYSYFATNGFSFGSTTTHWRGIATKAREDGMVFSPSVAPGYDDRRIRPWNLRAWRPRASGGYYSSMWRAALAAVREGGFVTVTSWNEFGEGTQIEPCIPHTVKDGEGIPNSMRDALGEPGKRKSEDYGEAGPFHYLAVTRTFAIRLAAPPSEQGGGGPPRGRAAPGGTVKEEL